MILCSADALTTTVKSRLCPSPCSRLFILEMCSPCVSGIRGNRSTVWSLNMVGWKTYLDDHPISSTHYKFPIARLNYCTVDLLRLKLDIAKILQSLISLEGLAFVLHGFQPQAALRILDTRRSFAIIALASGFGWMISSIIWRSRRLAFVALNANHSRNDIAKGQSWWTMPTTH